MNFDPSKRQAIKTLMALGVSAYALPFNSLANSVSTVNHGKPKLEELFAIGMGSWITFNVGDDTTLRNQRTQVLDTFFKHGGQLIDTSPMYGSSEEVIGYSLKRLGQQAAPFSATKTWTRSSKEARKQFENSVQFWGSSQIDLLQIHNLLAWQRHLPFLRELKQQKLIRYIGITTSHGRRHSELLDVMKQEDIDLVQLTYNIADREVENTILPQARDKGIKIIANRPLQGGRLMDKTEGLPLPKWASEIGCQNWSHYFLRFIVSHPDIQFAIPATSKVEHMVENMTAINETPLPNAKQRLAMIRYFESL